MNLYHKIAEVRNNIDYLQGIANKHKANNKKRLYNSVSQVITENKHHLKELNEDLKKYNKLIIYRLHHEQHD